MSAAPRPVTATVTKGRSRREEALQQSLHELSRPLDSSSDSTTSLCSVLDHDSYESVSTGSSGDESKGVLSSPKMKDDSSPVTTETSSVKPKERLMTAWETWLVRKEKLLRQKMAALAEKKKHEQRKREEEEKIQREKVLRAENVRKTWLEHKNQQERERRQMEKQEKMEKDQEKENKKKVMQERSQERYEEWIECKRKLEREASLQGKEERKLKSEEERERKAQSEAAFEAWCKKAQKQPRPLNNSFGYTCGKLTGYHDKGSYPVPSFYNPIPWRAPDIPKEKTDKPVKKKTLKYKWNPDKYY